MISVIIPSYRPQHFTLECLDSLKQQTLPPEEFEVIVVLNGDKEPYFSMLQEAMPRNGRLLYSDIPSACTSRNIGIDEAMGDYICFIDDDDKVSETYLEELSKAASRDVVAASHCLSVFDDNHIEKNVYSGEYEKHAHRGIVPFQQPKKIFSVPWMKLVHRDIIADRRFNTQFPSGQDALLMFEISDRMRSVKFTSPKAVYYWRQRMGSLHRLNRMKIVSKYARLAWAYTKLYFQHPQRYSFHFYLTRLFASFHGILAMK